MIVVGGLRIRIVYLSVVTFSFDEPVDIKASRILFKRIVLCTDIQLKCHLMEIIEFGL